MTQILQGFLENEFPDAAALVQDTTEVVGHISVAVEYFNQLSMNSAIEGLNAMAEALQALGIVLRQAGVAESDLKKIAVCVEQLKAPKDFFLNVGKELVLNGKEILGSVDSFTAHFEAKDWVSLGKDFGGLIATLTAPAPADAELPWPFSVCCPSDTEQPQYATGSDTTAATAAQRALLNEEALASVLRGLLSTELPDTYLVLADTSVVLDHVSAALAAFEQLSLRSAADGLGELAEALDAVRAALIKEDASHADVARLATAAQQMRAPKEFMLNVGRQLVLNGKDISGLVGSTVAHARAEEWESLGGDLGGIMEKLAAPAPADASYPWPFSVCCASDAP